MKAASASHEGLAADTKHTKITNRLRGLRGRRKATFVAIIAAIVGCSIAWSQRVQTHGSVTTTVLFDREIVRVLNDHCVMCHMEGGLAFPLETYEQTWRRGQTIRTSVLRHHMPPWSAIAGYGSFANENRLTVREAQFVISWVEGLGPRNAGNVFLNVANPDAARPEVRAAYSHAGHWMIGTPDLKRELTPTTIQSQKGDVVVRTVVDLGLDRERRVDALEYMPGDRRVVRAATFTVEGTGQWLGSWTPWHGFVKAPGGSAFRLPAGARMAAEVQYRGTTETVVDRGTIGVTFADERATREISDLVLVAGATAGRLKAAPTQNDAAGATAGRLKAAPTNEGVGAAFRRPVRRANTRLAADTYVWALQPRIVPGLTSIQVTARKPDGRTDILLFARDISTEWPTPYLLARPVLLPKGTELSVSAHYVSEPPADRTLLTISRYNARPAQAARR